MINYSAVYIERIENTLYFCHKGHDYFVRDKKTIPVYDKDGNYLFDHTVTESHRWINLKVTINDYINAESQGLSEVVVDGYVIGFMDDYYVSHNFKVLKVIQCFEVDGGYCERRNAMSIIFHFLSGENHTEYWKAERKMRDKGYFEIDGGSTIGYIGKYRDEVKRTIKNSFPIEIIGHGGKAMFIKVHKSLKPILYSDYTFTSRWADDSYFDCNKNFIKQYFEGIKYDTLSQKLRCSIKFLERYEYLKGYNL